MLRYLQENKGDVIMKIQKYSLAEIAYETKAYPETLYESIKRMGLGFPILVKRLDNGHLVCVDGHKRCSAIADILRENPTSRLQNVSVIFEGARSDSGTTKNHH